MSLTIPHVRARADVLVHGNVIVTEDDDVTDTTLPGGSLPGGVSTGANTASSSTLVASPLNDDLVGFYDCSIVAGWKIDNQVSGLSALDPFVFPQVDGSAQTIDTGYASILNVGEMPAYAKYLGARINAPQFSSGGYTWEMVMWVDTSQSGGSEGRIIYHSTSTPINIYFQKTGEQKLVVSLDGDVYESNVKFSDFLVTECWSHFLFTFDDSSFKLYWNSDLVLSVDKNLAGVYEHSHLMFSSHNMAAARLASKVSLIRLYDKPFSADEVSQNYAFYNKTYLFGGDLLTNAPVITN